MTGVHDEAFFRSDLRCVDVVPMGQLKMHGVCLFAAEGAGVAFESPVLLLDVTYHRLGLRKRRVAAGTLERQFPLFRGVWREVEMTNKISSFKDGSHLVMLVMI